MGPVLLLVLVAISLWSLQHRASQASASSEHSRAGVSAAPTVGSPPAAPRAPTTSSTPVAPISGEGPGVEQPASEDGTVVPPGATAAPRDPAQARRFASYVTSAEQFMRAFARPPASTPPSRWWAAVRPQLSTSAAADYLGTDPQRVPYQSVTGPGAVMPTDAPGDLLTIVRVPTDAGAYLVEMATDEAGIHVSALTLEQPAGAP